MIQRVQSVYLLIAFHLSAILIWFSDILIVKGEKINMFNILSSQDFVLIVIGVSYVVSGVMSLISMMLYGKRLIQKRINTVNILLNFILFGLLLFYLVQLSGESMDSLKGIGVWLPLGSIVLLLLANRAIQKDENLVKSVDRIR